MGSAGSRYDPDHTGRGDEQAMPFSRDILHACRLAALAAGLACGLPGLAQEGKAPSDPSVTERLGGAIRGFFQSIFGSREGELPAPTPRNADHTPSPPPAGVPAAQEPAAQAAPAPASPKPAAPSPAAVTATPEAQPASQSLHSAIAKGDYASAMKMIEGGVDIEMKDPGAGASALHYAVMKGALPMVGLLLQRGADVNSRTKSGTTPLHTAVLYGHFEVAEYLLEKGADVNAKSASGVTPLNLALAANFQRIEKLLRGRGAN